jgi:hypothetical protein
MPTLTLDTAVNDGAAATATLQIFGNFLARCTAFFLLIHSFGLMPGVKRYLIDWMVFIEW